MAVNGREVVTCCRCGHDWDLGDDGVWRSGDLGGWACADFDACQARADKAIAAPDGGGPRRK